MQTDYEKFHSFYTNEAILSIADNQRWTITSDKKVPLDIKNTLTLGYVHGAKFTDERSLVALGTILNHYKHTPNVTYYLDVLVDDLIVLDIEPECPNDIKQDLLKLPAFFRETSMSGKGIHLIMKPPKNFYDFDVATKKVALKHEKGYYEILLNHYVTFTRNEITDIPEGESSTTIEKIYEDLAKETTKKDEKIVDVSINKPDDIYHEQVILTQLSHCKYNKTPEDFYDDMSKYEYGVMSYLKYKLFNILTKTSFLKDHEYNDNEKAWLLYEASIEALEYRPKHEELRNNMPWLLNESRKIIARIDKYENIDTKEGNND